MRRELLLLLLPLTLAAAPPPPTPSSFLGFTVGEDRKLADYKQISAYFRALDAASPRVEVVSLGKTTLGEEMLMAVISSEENLRNLVRLKDVSRKLSDPRGLSPAQAEALVREGKVVLLVTCNIHSTEIGSTQMAMEWAHALATADDPETKRRLSNVVLLLVPSLNPDGQTMETEWYRKNLGTRFEGSRMPWLYHHYVGHDDNRDWTMLTQKETRAMTRAAYKEWFPQVWLDEHQMGATGPRIFMPPYAEPVDADIHPLVWREVNLIGSTMALRLEQAGKTGVIYGYTFDAYWPGGTKNTAWWKNVTGLLTEVASPRIATPVYVDPTELSGRGKGLVEYTAQTNFPNPWPGGWWRLRDVMDYERIASDALLESCSDHREDLLRDMVARARSAIATGGTDAYRIPARQRDRASARRLAQLMAEHGVDLSVSAEGDVYIPLAQPYGRFVAEMLEPQRYPEVKLVPGKEIVRPYDVAAWTLPLMMGVTVERVPTPVGLKAFDPSVAEDVRLTDASAFALLPQGPEEARVLSAALRSKGTVQVLDRGTGELPAGAHLLDAVAARAASAAASEAGITLSPLADAPKGGVKLRAPRVGLYKPWAASMDEGWTRWLLEQYGFAPVSLDNRTIKAGKLRDSFDAIVLPYVDKDVIATGKPKREDGEMKYFAELPPEYAGGLEKEGAKALREFVEGGGTLVAMAASTGYLLEDWNLPVRNVLAGVKSDEFACPGSLLRVNVATGHPLTRGLPAELPVFVDKAIAFETTIPTADVERAVLASYPTDGRDVLMSGWINGPGKLTRRAAAVAVTMGKGRVVLLGFRPQHRAQTPATYPFLFNALLFSVR